MYRFRIWTAITAAIAGVISVFLITLPMYGMDETRERTKADQRLQEAADVFSEIITADAKVFPRTCLIMRIVL